jgi:hypothetical protein
MVQFHNCTIAVVQRALKLILKWNQALVKEGSAV